MQAPSQANLTPPTASKSIAKETLGYAYNLVLWQVCLGWSADNSAKLEDGRSESVGSMPTHHAR